MKFINSIQSEWIKRRRSAVSWLVLVGGLFIPAIILVTRLLHHSATLMSNSTNGIWMKLFNLNWQYVSIFLLPMGISLAASLITQIEFRNNAWKQVYSSPQSISAIFWSKYVVVIAIMIQFFILFTIGIFLTGFIPSLVFSDVPFPKESFPIKEFLDGNITFFIYCLPILALQYLLSLHIKNFIIPIGAGFALLTASLIGMSWEYGYILPYTYGAFKFIPTDNKIDASINFQHWSLCYFVFFTLLNYVIFLAKSKTRFPRRVNLKRIFTLKKIVASFVIIAITIGIVAIFSKQSTTVKLPENSNSDTQEKIKSVETNLGAFVLPNANDWSIEARMRYYKVPGLSIAVINNFKVVWAKGYGYADSAENRKVNELTLFVPGSLSKSANAVGILKLVQDKKIDLFADINNSLTSWKFPYDSMSKNKKITLANLLSHTAGLSVHGFYGYKEGDTLPNIVQILNGVKPANSVPVRSIFEPGLKMEYSGGGVMISQLMLMDASHQSYDEYMYNTIFKPLEMSNSSFTQPPLAAKKNFLATGYDSLGREVKGKYPIMAEQAAAGLWTTPTDLCKFIIEIQRSLKGESNKILSKQNTEIMLTPYLDDRSALGFFVNNNGGYQYFGHDAGNVGFSGSFYGSFEEGNGVAVFINSENSDILKEVVNSVIDSYHWKGFPKKEALKTLNVPDTIMQKYLGKYESKDENGKKVEIEIYMQDNLYFYRTNGHIRKMYFTSNTDFVNNENPSRKSFKVDQQGNVLGILNKYMQMEVYFRKVK